MNSLGEKLHLLRKQAGYSQEELAYKVDVTRQTVSLWESNSLIPKADKLKMLCEIFNVSSDYLLFDSATEQRSSDQIDDTDKSDEEPKSDNTQTKKKTKNIVIKVAVSLSVLFSVCLIVLACLMVSATHGGGYETVTAIRFDTNVLLWLIIIISVIVVVSVALLVIALIKARKK